MKRIFITLLGLTLSNLSAQQKTHTVIAKENLYSISRKYEISIEELVKHNPKIKNGTLNIGDVLTIPNNSKSSISKNSGTKNPSQKLGKIILQPKQTIYGITKQYKISEAELRRLNPDLDNHMKIGDAVILPEENIKKYRDILAQNNPTSPSPKEEIKNNSASNNVITYTIQPKDTYYKYSGINFDNNKSTNFAVFNRLWDDNFDDEQSEYSTNSNSSRPSKQTVEKDDSFTRAQK